jgi:hypothetical protein
MNFSNYSDVTGFDLDGVLVADLMFYEPVEKYLHNRSLMNALFVPKKPYVIITGRPYTDTAYTIDWALRELKENPPIKIFHGNQDINRAHLYKADMINQYGIERFVESDLTQVEYLRLATKAKIYHFKELVSHALYGL